MQIDCTFQGEAVTVVEIVESQISGFLDIVYVNSSNLLKRTTIQKSQTIATDVTSIDGVST